MIVMAIVALLACAALHLVSAAFRKLGDQWFANVLKNVSALLLVVFAGAAVTGVVQQFDERPSSTTGIRVHEDEEGYEEDPYEEEQDDYVHPGYHYVDDYYRSDGTHVDGHWRSNPNEHEWDNINY